MKYSAAMDNILLSDYGLPPVGAVIENYELDFENKILIILDHCFNYYVKGIVDNNLKKYSTKKGIKEYFNDKRKELVNWWLLRTFNKEDDKNQLRQSFELFLDLCTACKEVVNFEVCEENKKMYKYFSEREKNNFERRARKNRRSIRQLMENIYQARAKVLVLRIDLWFEYGAAVLNEETKELKFLREDVNLLADYRDQFIDHLREEYGANLLGYVWRLEYGSSRGYHLHFMIMLDGQHHCKDVLICQSLGDYWKSEITKFKGGYFNCNARKKTISEFGYWDGALFG